MTEVTAILGLALPDGITIQVHAWRWEGAVAESGSLAAFKMIEAASKRTDRPDSGVGVYRSRLADRRDDRLYLFLVDVNRDLLGREPDVGRAIVSWLHGDPFDPPRQMAESLVLRHIRTWADHDDNGKHHSRAHYGLGLLVDQYGHGKPVVGQG